MWSLIKVIAVVEAVLSFRRLPCGCVYFTLWAWPTVNVQIRFGSYHIHQDFTPKK